MNLDTSRRRRLWVAAMLATGMHLAHGVTPLSGASDGVWQASIAPGADAAVLNVRRLGPTPESRTNSRFLPSSVVRADGEWRVTVLAVAGQRLTVGLRLSSRTDGTGNSQDKLFEFDLSQRDAPLVRFDTVTRRDGLHDVHRFDLVARTSAWCRAQATPDLAHCAPVTEPLLARKEAADVGLETMPSAEQYTPPVVPNIVYGAPRQQEDRLPGPAR